MNLPRTYPCIALLGIALLAPLSLAVSGCSRSSDAEKARLASESAAHKTGEEAYKLAHKSKEAAQQAGRELRKTGNQSRLDGRTQNIAPNRRAKRATIEVQSNAFL